MATLPRLIHTLAICDHKKNTSKSRVRGGTERNEYRNNFFLPLYNKMIYFKYNKMTLKHLPLFNTTQQMKLIFQLEAESIFWTFPNRFERKRFENAQVISCKTECGNYRGISLVLPAVKVLLKVVVRRLNAYCEAKGLLPGEQCGFQPNRSATDMMFVVRRLQEIGRKAGVSLFMCFIDLQKAYDTVDRTLLWQVLTRIGVPPQVIEVIQQFHDGMRACVRPDDGVCSD